MGRTFEALSQTRIKSHLAVVDEEIPPTAIVSVFQSEIGRASTADAGVQLPGDQASSDTALLDELAKDNDGVPFIEVGPKGSQPIYGPMVGLTPVPNPAPLRLNFPLPPDWRNIPMPPPDWLKVPPPPMVEFQKLERPNVAVPPREGRKLERPNVPLPPMESQKSELPVFSVAFYPMRPTEPKASDRIAPDLIAFHRPEHPVSANYRSLLAGIASQQSAGSCPLLIFTTVGREVEASSAILNLAITRAREESRRVLVIEANHERPLIADRLGIASLPGLRELLNRSIPMSVALHATAQSNLFALPPGDPDLPVSEEAEGRLPFVVQQLRKRFDWVVVNGPEWGSGGIAEWANLGDAVYLVVGADQWDSPEVEAAHEAIVGTGGKLRGYVTLRRA